VIIFIGTINGNKAELTEEESLHCAKVLRKKAGDEITVINGSGTFFKARLETVGQKKCVAEIMEEKDSKPRNYYLHLAIAPTKQIDRIEWMLEKCVEIGIDEISFIQCKNSERVSLKVERMKKIVESAVKQSMQAYLPKVNELCSFKDILKVSVDQKFIAHCDPSEKLNVRKIVFNNKKSLVLIGPEGDFTKEEIALAREYNFSALSLGENRLRTETAGLYITQAISILSQP
jgi:16S rRNA (uracil1498-N3)-methyltransferase